MPYSMDAALPSAPDAPPRSEELPTATNGSTSQVTGNQQLNLKPDTKGYVSLKAGQIKEVIKKKQYRPNTLTYTNKKTGLCYDVRMRYHATVDEGDMHPEDPRRIYFIYRALVEDGLIDDEDDPMSTQLPPAPILVKFRAREVTKVDACLVHTEAHWKFIESTSSESDLEALEILLTSL